MNQTMLDMSAELRTHERRIIIQECTDSFVLYYLILYSIIIILYCIILYYITLYYIILYYIIFIILYCSQRRCSSWP